MDSHRDGESRIIILGVGNTLLKDEGVGVWAVESLRRSHAFPANVELIDGGTAGLDLLDLMRGASHVIVVDCVIIGQPPGTVVRVPMDDLVQTEAIPHSLHQIGMLQALGTLGILGFHPEAVLIGIQPETIGLGLDLSPLVASKLPSIVQGILRELERLGVQSTPVGSEPPGSPE